MSGYVFGGLRPPEANHAGLADSQIAAWSKHEKLLGNELRQKYRAVASDGSQETGKKESALLFSDAEEHLDKAVSLVKTLHAKNDADMLYEAKLLQKLAWVHMFEGQMEEAEQATRESLEIIQELGNEVEEGVALLTLATVCAAAAQFGEAMYAAKQARAIFKEQGNSVAEGIALLKVSRLHFNFGRFRKAEVAAKESQVLCAEAANLANEADALYLLSHIHLASGEYDQSLRAGKQSQSLWRDIFDDQAEFNQMLLMCQAALFIALQAGAPLVGEKPKTEWTKAFSILDDAKKKGDSTEARKDENVSQVCFMTGQAHYGTKEFEKASSDVQEGIMLAQKTGDAHLEAHLNLLSGYISMNSGKKGQALNSQKQAAASFKKLGDAEGEAEAEKFYVELMGPRKVKEKKIKLPKGKKR
jgi:tetratricopeptide (TPR) repeat protein